MSGTRTAALVCGTAREGPLGAGPLSAGEASAVGGTSAAAAGTVGADTGEVLLAAVVPVVWGLLPSAPPPAVVPAPAAAEVLGPSLPVFVLSEASAPVVPVVAVPVVCEPLSALDVEPPELVPLVVVVLLVPVAVVVVVLLVPVAVVVVVLLVLVCVCVVPVSVPAGDAGSAVAGPGVGGTVVAVASAAAGGSLTGPDGSSPVTAVTAVAAVAAAEAVAEVVADAV
jgi:hypothetical protein